MPYLKAMAAAFWPQSRRKWWFPESRVTFERAALLGAVLQSVLFGLLFSYRYSRMLRILEPQVGAGALGSDVFLGVLAFASELFDPLGLPSLYLAIEGVIRALLIVMLDEVYPTLPLFIGVALGDGWKRRRVQLAAAEVDRQTPDQVERTGEMIIISTARLKPDWDGAALSVEGTYFQVAGPHPGTRERPYVYILRPWPAGIVIRKTRTYDGGVAAPVPVLAQTESSNPKPCS